MEIQNVLNVIPPKESKIILLIEILQVHLTNLTIN